MTLRTHIAQWTAQLAVRLHPHLQLRTHKPDYAFAEDGLATIHNHEFAADPRFQRAYAAGKATGSWHDHDLRWRIHVLLWAATHGAYLTGCFVECGVYRGGFAKAIIDYTDFSTLNRNYYLFDTFNGFDSSLFQSGENETVGRAYHYEDCLAAVQRDFANFPFVTLVPGAIPQTLRDVGPIAFLSIDMNCVTPEIAAVRYFWPHLVSGAMIVLDDYGFEVHRQQKVAFDALANEWGVSILSLPTGQGLIYKP